MSEKDLSGPDGAWTYLVDQVNKIGHVADGLGWLSAGLERLLHLEAGAVHPPPIIDMPATPDELRDSIFDELWFVRKCLKSVVELAKSINIDLDIDIRKEAAKWASQVVFWNPLVTKDLDELDDYHELGPDGLLRVAAAMREHEAHAYQFRDELAELVFPKGGRGELAEVQPSPGSLSDANPMPSEAGEFRSSRWFTKATGRALNGDLLRKAARDDRALYREPVGEQRYEYAVSQVKRLWPEHRAMIDAALAREKNRPEEPGTKRKNPEI